MCVELKSVVARHLPVAPDMHAPSETPDHGTFDILWNVPASIVQLFKLATKIPRPEIRVTYLKDPRVPAVSCQTINRTQQREKELPPDYSNNFPT